jgi:glycosyltransferase involved in cell wall biosynthesis
VHTGAPSRSPPERRERAVSAPRARLVLAANARAGVGGQGLNMAHMIKGLSETFDVEVFAAGSTPEFPAQVVPPSRLGRALHAIPVLRRRRDLEVALEDRHFDRAVARRLAPAAIFHGATGQCRASLARASTLGARTVLDVVTMHIDVFGAEQERESALFGIRPPISRRLQDAMRAEYQAADLIRVMSERAARTFLERGFDAHRIVVVPPPLMVEQFPEPQWDAAAFRVSFVGLIEPWKGFHHLIEAFHGLDRADAELVLWGGPGSRPVSRYLAEHQARDRRITVRAVEVRGAGLAEVYGRSSVVVLPSLAEGFGYAAAEAMACGVPVIVSDRMGVADLIEDGRNGYIVPVRDVPALRERLVELAASPALRRAMGRAARDTARQLTLEAFRRCYIPRLEALLSTRRS